MTNFDTLVIDEHNVTQLQAYVDKLFEVNRIIKDTTIKKLMPMLETGKIYQDMHKEADALKQKLQEYYKRDTKMIKTNAYYRFEGRFDWSSMGTTDDTSRTYMQVVRKEDKRCIIKTIVFTINRNENGRVYSSVEFKPESTVSLMDCVNHYYSGKLVEVGKEEWDCAMYAYQGCCVAVDKIKNLD